MSVRSGHNSNETEDESGYVEYSGEKNTTADSHTYMNLHKNEYKSIE